MSFDRKMVQVNAGMRTSGTTSNFSIDYLTRELDNVREVTMIKATLLRMFTNISYYNNQLIVEHEGFETIYTVPVGQYTADTLATALTNAASGGSVSFAYDSAQQKFVATYSSVTTSTIKAKSSIARNIGLMRDILLGPPTALQAPPNLSGPNDIYIHSELVAASSCVTAGSRTSIPLVGVIGFGDVPYGFNGRFDSPFSSIDLGTLVCIRKINVKLCDVFGNEIVLPENCFLDMILQFKY